MESSVQAYFIITLLLLPFSILMKMPLTREDTDWNK